MKPYQQIPIHECHEALVAIPIATFAVEDPHAYVKLGAPYGDKSPYYLRQGVLERLTQAQGHLQQLHPDWRIQIFDAYRPIAVQQFMVDHAFGQAVQEQGLILENLTPAQHQAILEQVQQFWATPSHDPKTPPPHSTGAAIDVTLVDEQGQPVDMGSPIDEMSPRSYPNYYDSVLSDASRVTPIRASIRASIADEQKQTKFAQYRDNRKLLQQIMNAAGFAQHPQEWWHFSYGDQLWAWLCSQKQPDFKAIARYGAS